MYKPIIILLTILSKIKVTFSDNLNLQKLSNEINCPKNLSLDRMNIRRMSRESSFIFSLKHYENSNNDDTVSTFMAKHPDNHFCKPDYVDYMWFNTKGNKNLIFAELHLYREFSYAEIDYYRSLNVTIYRVIEDYKSVYVNSVKMPENYVGWFKINITDGYKYWSENPERNRGINVTIITDGKELIHARPEQVGIVGFDDDETEKHPFMVAHFKNQVHDNFETEIFDRMDFH